MALRYPCMNCGRGVYRRHGRFCSAVCAAEFDERGPDTSLPEDDDLADTPRPAEGNEPTGVDVDVAHGHGDGAVSGEGLGEGEV